MTLAASVSKIVLNGDGLTTAFGFPFELQTADGSDIQVTIFDNQTPQNQTILSGNFTVNVGSSQVNYPTVAGVAPLAAGVTALPVGWQIVINRVEALDQETVLADEGPISLSALEEQLDYLTAIVQQLQEQVNRCIKLPVNQSPNVATVTVNGVTISSGTLIGAITLSNTYANLKATPPAAFSFAWATDIGAGALVFYSGNAAIGDQGWFGPLVSAPI